MAGQPHSDATRSGFRRRRSAAWASFRTIRVTGVVVAGASIATGSIVSLESAGRDETAQHPLSER